MSLEFSFQESSDVSFAWSLEPSDVRSDILSFGLSDAKSDVQSFDRSIPEESKALYLIVSQLVS